MGKGDIYRVVINNSSLKSFRTCYKAHTRQKTLADVDQNLKPERCQNILSVFRQFKSTSQPGFPVNQADNFEPMKPRPLGFANFWIKSIFT